MDRAAVLAQRRDDDAGLRVRLPLGAVHRIAVSQDQSFFASASADGTTKVWGTLGLERDANPGSLATYTAQDGEIVDACNVDNARAVATASDAGTVHVWRVELLSSLGGGCLLYTSPSPRDRTRSRMPSSA